MRTLGMYEVAMSSTVEEAESLLNQAEKHMNAAFRLAQRVLDETPMTDPYRMARRHARYITSGVLLPEAVVSREALIREGITSDKLRVNQPDNPWGIHPDTATEGKAF